MPFADTPDPVESILEGLTDDQRRAVTHPGGPLLVIAGAGSGKTRVITCRIAWLMAAQDVSAENIIAITFTNKAADEMRRRVQAMGGGHVRVSTFHSLCASILRRSIEHIGMDPNFTIYDRADSSRVVRRVIREMGRDDVTFKPSDLLEYISSRKERVQSPEAAKREARFERTRIMAEGYRRYQAQLRNSNALDFDDLLLKVLELFSKAPQVLADLQDRYEHVLVDEYQDTNLPQHAIAKALHGKHKNITVVGDPDQTIYTWRGARIGNLMEFEEEFPGTERVMLERNYRSSASILEAANHLVRHNQNRYPKKLWTEAGHGNDVLIRSFDNSHEEASWVAEAIQQMIEEGTDPSEIGVFYRTRQQSGPLERAMVENTIPYQVMDSTRLHDRACVKDLRAYLQLLVNYRDDVALLRAINTPTRGIGAKTVERLQNHAMEHGLCLMDVVERPDDVEALGTRAVMAVERFGDLMNELDAHYGDDLPDLLNFLVEHIGYIEAQKADEVQEVEETIDMFRGDMRAFVATHPEGDLQDYLEQTALMSDADTMKDQPSVPLMTLHSTKGLEFDNVFIVGLEQDILPHRRSLEDPGVGTDEDPVEEERRLFYVGMTRARRRLFITHADYHVTGSGGGFRVLPSDFLEELPATGVRRERAGGRSRSYGGKRRAGDLHRRQQALRREYGMDSAAPAYKLKGNRKISLTILDGNSGDRLAEGVRVSHPQFGQGTISKVEPMASRIMMKVSFDDTGPMSLLLNADDVVEAE